MDCSEGNRQRILDAMRGQVSEKKLINLLPTENLRKKFHENIESYMKATLKEKTLTKEEIEQLLVRKILTMTKPNSEFDILFFQKVVQNWNIFYITCLSFRQKTETVYQFESKAMKIKSMDVESLDEKSLKQLE